MKVKHVIIAASAVIIALVAAFYFVLRNERSQLQEEKDLFASEQKEIMQEELQKLASEYDIQYQKLSQGMGEQKISLATDSLISQLLSERAKVEQLQKELKSNKATSAKRIGQLTQEISTLRNVLKNYVIQIDSLQSANDRLRQENSEVRASYARATNEAQQLSNEKAQLSDRVKLAAKLDATRISITPMDKRGKLSKKLEKTVNIQIHFTVAKNVTAAVGEKTFYCRITQPNEELLVKPGAGTFPSKASRSPIRFVARSSTTAKTPPSRCIGPSKRACRVVPTASSSLLMVTSSVKPPSRCNSPYAIPPIKLEGRRYASPAPRLFI